jgi:hypothetical protein
MIPPPTERVVTLVVDGEEVRFEVRRAESMQAVPLDFDVDRIDIPPPHLRGTSAACSIMLEIPATRARPADYGTEELEGLWRASLGGNRG